MVCAKDAATCDRTSVGTCIRVGKLEDLESLEDHCEISCEGWRWTQKGT